MSKRPVQSLRSTDAVRVATPPDVSLDGAVPAYKKWIILSLLLVIGCSTCTRYALGRVVGEDAVVTQGFDPETWKPCPGRRPTWIRGHKYVWYCGPDQVDPRFGEAK